MGQKEVENENYCGVFEMRDLGRFFSEVLRLAQKLNWLLEKVGRKWKLKKGALQVIIHFLKMIGEIEYLLGEMEKTIVRTFGIGGIITTEKKETGLVQEIKRIQGYNSP